MNLVERLHQRRAKHSEKGMASVMYILLILVVCSALGLGVDSAIGNFTSNGLRSIADMSVMDAASSKTGLIGNTRSINQAKAKEAFISRYNVARQDYPNVTAKNPSQPKHLNFTFQKNSSNVTNAMTAHIVEESHTRFLALVGIDKFTHRIDASARLGALYENR